MVIDSDYSAKPISESKFLKKSIGTCFSDCAERHGTRLAVSDAGASITYSALNSYVNSIAHYLLQVTGDCQQARIGIFLEKGIQFVASVLAVLKSGHVFVPIDPQFPAPRNKQITEDAGLSLMISAAGTAQQSRELEVPELRVIHLEDIPWEGNSAEPDVCVSPESAAAIIYTSGSTGRPKGVVHSHESIMHCAMRRARIQQLGENDRISLLFSPSVMGTVNGLFSGILNGAALFCFDPGKEGVGRLPEWLESHRITVIHLIASLFRALVRESRKCPRRYAVRLVAFGGERVLVDDVLQAQEIFGKSTGIFAGLGSTETGTICHFPIDDISTLKGPAVPIGKPVEGISIELSGGDNSPGEESRFGEITVLSPYIALGYWHPESCAVQPFGPDHGVRRYRMGDLASLGDDGVLEHRGRVDFQSTIRGFRVEPGEIESVIQAMPQIREAAVVPLSRDGQDYLAAYLVLEDGCEITQSQFRDTILRHLPRHMLPGETIILDALPRTPNGKLDRLALPEPESGPTAFDADTDADADADADAEGVAENSASVAQDQQAGDKRYSEEDHAVLEICQRLLGREKIELEHNFLDIGGHSIIASQLVSELSEQFAVEFPMAQVFDAVDLHMIAENLRELRQKTAQENLSEKVAQAFSDPVQLPTFLYGIWLHQKRWPNSRAYHISNSFRIFGELDTQCFLDAIEEICERHQVFSLRFPERNGLPVFEVCEQVSQDLCLHREPSESGALRLAQKIFEQPFDIATGPLTRFALIEISQQEYLFVAVFHHLIFDNLISSKVFFEELSETYQAKILGLKTGTSGPAPAYLLSLIHI